MEHIPCRGTLDRQHKQFTEGGGLGKTSRLALVTRLCLSSGKLFGIPRSYHNLIAVFDEPVCQRLSDGAGAQDSNLHF